MEQITNEDLFSNFPQMNLCTPEEIELKTAGIKSLMEVIENE